MSKKEGDPRREVTSKDIETFDQAISAYESLGGFLYKTRYILGEIGKLEDHYRRLKDGIAMAEQQGKQVNAELDGVKAQLATAQKQEAEKRQAVIELNREIEQKEQLLKHYSKTIDRIMGTAA
jgi:chromosome segregation ATPase